MKKVKTKLCVLVLAAATPGFFAFSCTGVLGKQFRDAAAAGVATFIEAETVDLLDSFMPEE